MSDQTGQLENSPGPGRQLAGELVAVGSEVHHLDELVDALVNGQLRFGDPGDAEQCRKRCLDLAVAVQGDGQALGDGEAWPEPGLLAGAGEPRDSSAHVA